MAISAVPNYATRSAAAVRDRPANLHSNPFGEPRAWPDLASRRRGCAQRRRDFLAQRAGHHRALRRGGSAYRAGDPGDLPAQDI
jgi:4'-phosphopantetheinyl transferase EntD